MSTTAGITAQMALEAFERLDLIPTQGEWVNGDCACGLSAVLATRLEGGLDGVRNLLGQSYIRPTRVVSERLGLSRRYVLGFANGFDGERYFGDEPDVHQGYEDGRAAWEAVKHLAVAEGERT